MLIDILTALAVLVSSGLILGILLAVFIRFFGVEDDPKVQQLIEVLPSINCGACGFKGCHDYAEALAKGEAKPNLCIPGAKATAQAVGDILGVVAEPPKDMIAFVHCNGTCDVTVKKAEYDGVASCNARMVLYGGPMACAYGCIGCGDCATVCVSDAISIVDGVAVVDTSRCVGCGMCVRECPKKIISMIPQEAATVLYCSSKDMGAQARKACKNACIGCKKCEKACPEQAITVIHNCAVIDYEKCTGCGECAHTCPTGCLKNTTFPDLPEDFNFDILK